MPNTREFGDFSSIIFTHTIKVRAQTGSLCHSQKPKQSNRTSKTKTKPPQYLSKGLILICRMPKQINRSYISPSRAHPKLVIA